MQTEKQTTGPGKRAKDYVTIVQEACNKVRGFEQLYKELERAINVSGKSTSTLTNYGRQLAHLALHYQVLPTELDNEQVLDYLHMVKSNGSPCATFFKFTVYGMRYACRLRGLPYQQFSLPSIDHDEKLPIVLNDVETAQPAEGLRSAEAQVAYKSVLWLRAALCRSAAVAHSRC